MVIAPAACRGMIIGAPRWITPPDPEKFWPGSEMMCVLYCNGLLQRPPARVQTCRGQASVDRRNTDEVSAMATLVNIGQPIVHIEGHDKVTGRTHYTADL